MWQTLLKFAISFLLEKLIGIATNKWDEYRGDKAAKEEIKKKVRAIKNAKTKEELRNAIRDLSI